MKSKNSFSSSLFYMLIFRRTHTHKLWVTFPLGLPIQSNTCRIQSSVLHVMEVKNTLTVQVIWLKFHYHRNSIYISSYISFECHWLCYKIALYTPQGVCRTPSYFKLCWQFQKCLGSFLFSECHIYHYSLSYQATLTLEFICF